MATTFTDIEREKASLTDRRTERIKTHAAWIQKCDARLEWLRQRTVLLTDGVDLARLDRAHKVIEIRGDETDTQRGSNGINGDVRPGAINDAKRWLAENPASLQKKYVGVKNYASFGDQRCDCEYGLGPRHGAIVFSIGLTSECRKRDLTPDEIEDALYMLNILPALSRASKKAA